MSDATRLVVIRHGETEWNLQARIQGHHDSALTARGEAQAAALSPRLQAQRFAAVYASDLGRVRATAERLLGPTVTLHTRRDLRERCFGEWEGATRAELAERGGDDHAVFGADPDRAPPGGESLRAFQARSWAAIRGIAADHRGERVLVVTHGGVLRTCFREILGIDMRTPRRFSVSNLAYNELRHDGEHWFVESWGDVAHLDRVADDAAR